MPTILRVGQYRIFFYSDEGNEPTHAHIESAEKRAKFWLVPIELTWNDGYRSGELKEIEAILNEHLSTLVREWNDYFRV